MEKGELPEMQAAAAHDFVRFHRQMMVLQAMDPASQKKHVGKVLEEWGITQGVNHAQSVAHLMEVHRMLQQKADTSDEGRRQRLQEVREEYERLGAWARGGQRASDQEKAHELLRTAANLLSRIYRRKALTLHPDKLANATTEDEIKFDALSKAAKILSLEDQLRRYYFDERNMWRAMDAQAAAVDKSKLYAKVRTE